MNAITLLSKPEKREARKQSLKRYGAALKYAFLKYKMGGNIVFDPSESVKMTGNSGPYLLYSAVRAKKILARTAESEGKSERERRSKENANRNTKGK